VGVGEMFWSLNGVLTLQKFWNRCFRSNRKEGNLILFSVPIQTGPGAHPASCTTSTGSFLGVKRPRRGADHPPHLPPRLKKEYSYTPTPPLGLHGLF
jgi:hypothetical protein